MKTNTILKPNVRVQYPDNPMCEKVTYLKIPGDINLKSLDKDVRNGAVQFKVILEFARKKDTSNYVMIHTDNREMGYMAIMYLEACRKNVTKDEFFSEDDEQENPDADANDFM